ncbi:MAG: RHS repeat protein, partial [Gemmatales bacterium]|nr:RHS repeat protein [Gemmatales bacterium]
EPPNLIRYQRSPDGTLTRYDYNSLGQPLTVTVNYVDGIPNAGAPDEDRQTTYTYDALGRVLTVTGPDGLTTRNEYDPVTGNLVRVTQHYLPGQPAGYQNRYNLITAYGYDAAGRVVTTTTALGTALARTDWTCYDNAGRVVRTVQNASADANCNGNADGQQHADHHAHAEPHADDHTDGAARP